MSNWRLKGYYSDNDTYRKFDRVVDEIIAILKREGINEVRTIGDLIDEVHFIMFELPKRTKEFQKGYLSTRPGESGKSEKPAP